MHKHLTFARKFRNNWGLGGGKFLLIMFDEKWFWGLVLRSYAKAVAEFGIDPKSFSAYHRNHINKCMAVALTAFAFIDSIENGGIAHKLGLYRAQAHKIAKQMVREAVRQADASHECPRPLCISLHVETTHIVEPRSGGAESIVGGSNLVWGGGSLD